MTRADRIHPRFDVRLSATVRSGGLAVDGTVENVGAGGVFFVSEHLELVLGEGAAVEVELRPQAPLARVTRAGEVVRDERYFDGERVVRALAVRFLTPIELADVGLGDPPDRAGVAESADA